MSEGQCKSPARKLEEDEVVELNDLSPLQHDSTVYVNLSYTPSKLKQSALYRETQTMRRVEASLSKVRELESLNMILEDKVVKITSERDGIQSSLNSQIQMYKKLLSESESKYEARMKSHQLKFSERMDQLIKTKEEEAKFTQSQKQTLENQNQKLNKIIEDLNNRLNNSGDRTVELENQKQQLEISLQNTHQNLQKTLKQKSEAENRAKQRYDELSEEKLESQTNLKQEMNQKILGKEREIDLIKRQHYQEMSKVESKIASQQIMKNQQITDITKAFESETQRLNKTVENKENALAQSQAQLNSQKQNLLTLTQNYQAQINTLVHQKNRFKNELEAAHQENQTLIANANNERDQNLILNRELERDLNILREERLRMTHSVGDNTILNRQVLNLKDLLVESSSELQRCKEEFIKMGRERDILLIKLRELGYENEALNQIKYERDGVTGRDWRQSYYRSKINY